MPRDNAQGAAPDSNAAKKSDDPASPQTGATPRQAQEQASDSSSLMDHLGIPEDVQAQLRPKAEKPEGSSTEGNEGNEDQEAEGGSEQVGSTESRPTGEESDADAAEEGEEPSAEEAEGEEEGEEESAETADATARNPFKDKRVQERLGREKRKRERLEHERDQLAEENEAYRQQFEQLQNGQQEAALAVPGGPGLLGKAQTPAQLNALVQEAEALIELADANPDGVVDDKTGEVKHDARTLAQWKRDGEKIVRNAPMRLKQMEEFGRQRQSFEVAAREDFPDWFDESGNWRKDTKEFQSANAIAQRFPELRGRPEANYYLCALVEGFKALEARKGAGKSAVNGQPRKPSGPSVNGGRRGDIDPKAFAPRVPLAPHTATSTAREPGQSSQKKVTEAMNNVVEQGGSHEALVAAIEARRQSSAGRTKDSKRELAEA